MKYTETIMWKEINETAYAFKQIVKNNEKTIKALAEAIKNSGKTHFMLSARGTSDHAMMYLKYMLEIKTPYTAGYVAPSVVSLYDGAINYGNCVFIGCSQSGMAEDVNLSLSLAKSQGAITVAITNNEQSLMAKTAEYHLFCSAGEEVSVAATKTYSAQMFLSAWLVAELAGDKDLLDKLLKLPEQVEKVMPTIDKQTGDFAEDGLIQMKGGFVLSRGITYSIAFEQALKLQETAYKQMKGYASSDFYHGPMAMVDENTPVIVYAALGDGKTEVIRADQKKSIDKMISMNGPVYLITDDKQLVDDYQGKIRVAYLENDLGEQCAIFNFALFAQTLACKVSCGVGNTPDNPRVLNKITITV